MPDYNPAVAAGIKPPENDFANTLGTIANLQEKQALTGYYTLQGLQQQRQYEGLMAAADAWRRGEDPVAAGAAHGLNPDMLNQFQQMQANRQFMASHGGMMPQGLEASASAARNFAGAANERAQLPGFVAQSREREISADQAQKNDAAQAANAYFASGDRSAIIAHAQKYHDIPSQLGKQADIQTLANLPKDQFDKVAASALGGGLTAEQGAATVETQNAKGAPVYQTRAQFAGGGPQVGQTTAGKEEQAGYGKTLGEEPAKLASESDAAVQSNATLDQMRAESATWPMGKLSQTLMAAGQYLKPIANALGNHDFDQPVADFESFHKNSGTLVRQAVKEVSSRAAVQEFNLIAKQLPSAEMSRQGFTQIADQFSAVNDYKIAKQQAGRAWFTKNGSMDGFDADWNKNITPTAFIVSRMAPEQLHQVAAGLQKTPEGRALLTRMRSQLTYAKDNGLL